MEKNAHPNNNDKGPNQINGDKLGGSVPEITTDTTLNSSEGQNLIRALLSSGRLVSVNAREVGYILQYLNLLYQIFPISTTLGSTKDVVEAAINFFKDIVDIASYKLFVYNSDKKSLSICFERGDIALSVKEELLKWALDRGEISLIPKHTNESLNQILVPLSDKNQKLGVLILWTSLREKTSYPLLLSLLNVLKRQICYGLTQARELQKLKEIQEIQKQFIYTISHELKTPLSALLAGTELLTLEQGEINKETKEIINIITEAVKRLNRLIQDLLCLSRIDSGQMTLRPDMTDFLELVEESLTMLKSRYNSPIIKDFPASLPQIYADSERIRQVIDNIVSNAIKYSPDGGEIKICVKVEGSGVLFSCTDHGIGIPTEDLPFVGNRFYRVHSPSTEGIEGTGLGLSIAKHIIDMHKGRIWADSEVGKGSTFYFWIPFNF